MVEREMHGFCSRSRFNYILIIYWWCDPGQVSFLAWKMVFLTPELLQRQDGWLKLIAS